MSSDSVVKVENLGKCYQIYDTPRDRLKQFFLPRVNKFLGLESKIYFREFWALQNISFEIKKGETVGVIGVNGSGKSTLLQMICGTLNPTIGNIETHGRIAALLELGSGFNPEFTGRENVFLNAALLGLSQKETALRFSKISEFADIGDFIDQPVKTYSSGMYVRLAFAVIAHVDADILIIDEALAVGDIFFTQKCMRFLKNFQKTGSIIFVTHDTSSVLALCDKAVWLNKGKLMSFGDAKTTCEAYLSDYYSLYRAPKKASHDQSDIESVKNISRSDFRDCRQDQINNSTIRTDLEFSVFSGMTEFQQDSSQVDVEDVVFLTRENQPIKWFVGGELITLKIVFKANVDIERPIVGFLLKDKLGQALFGDNTFISYVDRPVFVQKNAVATAKFYFRMPVMPAGEYTLGIAVASGTQEEHVMHTWVHDALVIKSHSKNLATGLLGIPMVEIELTSYVR